MMIVNKSDESLNFQRSLKKERIQDYMGKYGVIVGVVLLIFVFSITTSTFFDPTNFSNVLKQASINAFLSIGMMMVIVTGGIELSLGSNVAVTCIVVAQMLQAGVPVFLAVLISVLTATLIGTINGSIIAYTGIPPFIVTLAMQTMCRGLALILSQGYPIYIESTFMLWLGRGNILGIPVSIVVLVFFALISWILMNRTKVGRYIYAIGGNRETAKLSGIKVKKYLTFAYAYAGFLTGIAAIIMAGRLTSGTPTIGVGYELDAVAATVLGGTSFSGGVGTVAGTLLGAIFIGTMNNGMTLLKVSPYLQNVVRGFVILLSVLVSVFSGRKKN